MCGATGPRARHEEVKFTSGARGPKIGDGASSEASGKLGLGCYSYKIHCRNYPFREALPRVALLVFFASAFRGCLPEGFSAEFRHLLPRQGFEDYA